MSGFFLDAALIESLVDKARAAPRRRSTTPTSSLARRTKAPGGYTPRPLTRAAPASSTLFSSS